MHPFLQYFVLLCLCIQNALRVVPFISESPCMYIKIISATNLQVQKYISFITNLHICKRKDTMLSSTLPVIPVVINFLTQQYDIPLLKAQVTEN